MNAWVAVVSAALGRPDVDAQTPDGTRHSWVWFPTSTDGKGHNYGVRITQGNGVHGWSVAAWRHEDPIRYVELVCPAAPTDRDILDLVRLAGLLHPTREQVTQ